MNFNHTEDRRMLADSLGRYFGKRYPIETRHAIVQSATGYSAEHWQELVELGAVGALFDAGVEGFGGDAFDITVVFEALGRALVVEPFLPILLAGSAIAQAGSDSQRVMLQQCFAGDGLISMACHESEGGYTLSYVGTTAKCTADGWTLDGVKAAVPYGAQAGHIIVSARVDGAIEVPEGIALFVVPTNIAGVTLRDYTAIDGGRAAELHLHGVTLPDLALLGNAANGYAILEYAVARGVLALCAEAVGVMDRARQMTLEYLQTRRQFGVPIGSFQALQHRMADLALEVEQARSAVINAAATLDQPRDVREIAISAAKFTIGRVGALVAEESIQLHGGIGMTWELPLAHYAKRLVMIDHQLGDEDFHLERYMAIK